MGNQTENDTTTLGAIEQCYREIRELRAITEHGFTQLGADLGKLQTQQTQTGRKIDSQNSINDLKFDAVTWLSLGLIVLLSQTYVSALRAAPPWLKAMLPGLEQPLSDGERPAPHQPESKQVLAFSKPGDLLRKGADVEGFPITSSVGWRSIWGGGDWHEGYDVGTPVGTPLYAVLPVEVTCLTPAESGGGGVAAAYQIGNERHLWLHLDSCNPGRYGIGEQFGTTGNTGRSTGPHLDYRVKDLASGEWVRPYADVLRLTLNPDAAIADATLSAGSTTAIIKEFEGFHPSPYWDFAQYSWGFGTKAPGPNGSIDEAAAERELLAYLERNCLPLISPLGLPENQVSALASLCYNIGPGQFEPSDAFKLASQGNTAAAADAFLSWTKAGGQVLPGLVRRRERERQIFLGE